MFVRLKKEKTEQIIILIFVYATLFIDILRKLFISTEFLEIVRNGIYIFCFFYVISKIIQERYINIDLVLLFLFPLQVVIPWCNESSLNKVVQHFVLFYYSRCFVGYYLFSRIINANYFNKYIQVSAILTILYSFILLNYGFDKETYMSSSYNLVLPACILLINSIINLNVFYLGCGLLAVVTILLIGARGALLAVVIGISLFTVYYLFRWPNTRKKSTFILISIMGIIIIIFNMNNIFFYIADHVNSLNSRTLFLIYNGIATNGGERINIYRTLLEEIINSPLSYRGLLMDRIPTAHALGVEPSTGTYAHNLFLEIFYQIGLLFGGIFLLIIIFTIIKNIKMIFRNKEDSFAILTFSLLPVGFVTLFFSGSYLISYNFWVLFGICVNGIKKGKKQYLN